MKQKVTLETIHEILIRVEAQVLRTNGRVGRLEVWRGIVIGGLIVISVIVVPLFLGLFK